MRVILGILKRDFKKIIKNPIAIIIIIGITVLPSLYAWFNIRANWDPYGSTSDMLVGVYNEDEGAELDGVEINIGDEIIDNLKANDQIGWQFVSKEEVMNGVTDGHYYAGVIIPKDFSQKFISITTQDIERPVLDYYVNEKINAIAPKITDSGISSLQKQVNETFLSTASEAVLTVSQKVKDNIEDDPAVTKDDIVSDLHMISRHLDDMLLLLDNLSNQTLTLDETINMMNTSLDSIYNLIGTTQEAIAQGQTSIVVVRNFAQQLNDTVDDELSSLHTDIKQLEKDSQKLLDSLSGTTDGASDILDGLSDAIDSMASSIQSAYETIDGLNKALPKPLTGLNNIVSRLQTVENNLTDLADFVSDSAGDIGSLDNRVQDIKDRINQTLNEQAGILDGLNNDYKKDVRPDLLNISDSLYNGLDSMIGALNTGNTLLPYVQSTLSGLSSMSTYTTKSLDNLKELLNNTKKDLDDFAFRIENNLQTERLNKIADIIENDPKLAAEFISSPVDVKKIELYPIPNYGSAMTPFYTILALWVGALIMVAILSCHVKEDEKFHDLKPYQTYWARYFFFMIIAIAQALVVSLGDFYVLGIYCANKPVFVLVAVLTSIVFSNIVYTLTTTFSDVGKAIAVIILVLQVAGSGGTFPIEVTPLFFKIINPLLPFTHAIRAMREAVGGIYEPTLLAGIFGVLAFLPISLAIGLVFRKPLMKMVAFFEHKLEETNLIK